MGRKRSFLVFTMSLAFFLVTANIIVIAPLLPFVSNSLAMSERDSAIVLAAFPLVAFVLNLVVGPFIDRYGCHKMLLVGACGCTFSFAISAAANNTVELAAMRVVAGLFMPLVGASIFVWLSNHLEADERVRAVGIVTAAASVAQLTVAPLALLVSERASWRLTFIALAALSLATVVCAASLWDTGSPGQNASISLKRYHETFSGFGRNAPLRRMSIAYVVAMIGVWIVQSVYPTWLFQQGLQAHQVAMLYVIAGIAGTVAGLNAGAIAARFAEKRRLLAYVLLAGAISCGAVVALPGTLAGQIVPFAALSASTAAFIPVARAVVNDLVRQQERGSLNALWNAFYQFASTVGATTGVLLLARSPTFALNGSITLVLLAGAATVVLSKK